MGRHVSSWSWKKMLQELTKLDVNADTITEISLELRLPAAELKGYSTIQWAYGDEL